MKYGLELILDIIDCNDNICDEKIIKKYLKNICKVIKMKRYGRPIVKHFGHASDKTSGYSAVQLIETSSIVCHFSENYKSAHINIFSCADFDEALATRYTLDTFGGKAKTHTILERVMG